ncbi:MAG: pyruvate kinase [Clostridia bacterium]|nr:pyruvate kinase [Clostridia bacterium]
MRKTKIIATLGPATDRDDTLRQLLAAGVDVVRMNMSHQDADTHRRRAADVRKISWELARPVALLVDTKGPEVRIGAIKGGEVLLQEGTTVTICPHPVEGDGERVSVSYLPFAGEVPPGAHILIDDGRLEWQAEEQTGEGLMCRVTHGGQLRAGKSVRVPGVSLAIPFLSEKDRADLKLACEMGADLVAASFTRSAVDVDTIRRELCQNGGEQIGVIAKIENAEGVTHLDEILRVADGVLIARGDLGMEYPLEELPAIQKEIIYKSYSAGVSVITATQMLESMLAAPRPTRAEVCDVAGAIYDGTSALMLSGETAAGDYPVEAVATMSRIAAKTEESIDYKARFHFRPTPDSDSVTEAMAAAAVEAAHRLKAAAIVTLSHTGRGARMLAKYRPACPIVCVTPDPVVHRQGMLTWGVVPLLLSPAPTVDLYTATVETARAAGWIRPGNRVVAVSKEGIRVISE